MSNGLTFDFDVVIDREKTACVTGHRSLPSDLDEKVLKEYFIKLIEEKGYDTFLIGMAVGFDTLCFNILEKIRKKKDIKIIACLPCLNQDAYFSPEQKKEYKRMLNSADKKILLQERYDRYCMLKRNEFMVDNSSKVLALKRKDEGGTAYTVRYANKKNVTVVAF